MTPNIPMEASVTNTLDAAKQYTNIAQQQRTVVAKLGVGEIKPGMETYWAEFENVMNNQIYSDPLGHMILKAMTGDMSDGIWSRWTMR